MKALRLPGTTPTPAAARAALVAARGERETRERQLEIGRAAVAESRAALVAARDREEAAERTWLDGEGDVAELQRVMAFAAREVDIAMERDTTARAGLREVAKIAGTARLALLTARRELIAALESGKGGRS